ncbi:MAG: type I restriction enzyme HsdR N-terminal domain-containing protein [Alphaproteobacteria bacterium]|nr:type I restriction enzyme HsdR N-terminal domain-containing protein [Alphaproteobacteria bacterium]
MSVSQKVETRISTELKRYRSILANAKQRDVSESDTVIIVADMLSDIFGYDKHQHVTTEHAIRGTYVDLAVVVDEDIRFLIEVKAIGIALKDAHVKQAVDYGANKGVEWVVLTNGATWRVYKIYFIQPIERSLVFEIDVLSENPKSADVAECFGILSREGFSKRSMSELLQQKQVTSRYALGALLLSDTILNELRRELRRISPGLKVDTNYLGATLENDVIKRELVDSEEAKAATSLIKKLQRSLARERRKASGPATEIPEIASQDISDEISSHD